MSQPAVGLLLAAEAYQRLPHDVDTEGGLQAAILANPYLSAILPGGPKPHRFPSRITSAGVVATMTDTEIRGSGTGEVVIIDRSGTTVARRQVADAVVGLTYLADGRLAITTINGVLTLADPNTLEPLTMISLPALALTGPVFATDGQHAVADLYQELAVLDLTGRSALATTAPGYTAAALSPDGHRVAAITTNGGTIVLDAKSLAPIAGPWQSPDIPPGAGYSITWSPDGQRFTVRGRTPPGQSPSIEVVDAKTGQVNLVPVAAPSVFGSSVSFTPDSHRLIVPDEFAGVELIDLTTKQQLAKGVDPNWGPTTDAAISPDGTRLALDTFGNEALLDTTTLQPLTACDLQAGFASWSTDGARLAVGTHSGDVVIADPDCHRQLTLAGSHASPTVRFSADGTQVFARDLNGTRIWDLQTARQIGTAFPDPNGTNGAFGVTAIGQLFSMAPSDQQLLLFDLDPDHWLADACTIAGRNLTTDEWNRYLGTLGPYRRTCPQNPSQP